MLLNQNRFTACDGVLTGFWGASNYDQGGLLNQWMQQITIGGLLPEDGDPKDACNPVTKLCLDSSRRLPLNSPTLDLRVNRQTPKEVLDLAAAALLGGGAHPVLLNDECIVKALSACWRRRKARGSGARQKIKPENHSGGNARNAMPRICRALNYGHPIKPPGC